MPRDSASAAVCPQTTPPPSPAPRAKRSGNGKRSGVSKAVCRNKDAPVPTWNLHVGVQDENASDSGAIPQHFMYGSPTLFPTGLEDTESLSDESLAANSEDSSAVSADDEGHHGFVMKGTNTPSNLVSDGSLKKRSCVVAAPQGGARCSHGPYTNSPVNSNLEIYAGNPSANTIYTLSRKWVGRSPEACTPYSTHSCKHIHTQADMLARLQHCLPCLGSCEVKRSVAQHVEDLLSGFMELRAQVDKSASSASRMLVEGNKIAGTIYAKSQGAYLDELTMSYFHRQMDMAYSLKALVRSTLSANF
eukprot:scaffold110893_cov17-Tisochrysis_lutea.AAC.1